MIINIKKFRSVPDMELELGNYTVFAGKNNAGKSNLILAIKGFFDKDKKTKEIFGKPIFIPSNVIDPKSEANTGNKTSNLSQIVNPILEKIVSEKILKETVEKFDKEGEKQKFEIGVNNYLEKFGVTDKIFGVKIKSQNFNEDTLRKLIDPFAKDMQRKKEEVDLNEIGQGTQRVMVASLIMAYNELEKEADNKLVILFEEPEAFLHPKLKRKLHETLFELSKDGHQIIISTHDPYFIQLNKEKGDKDNKIYNIIRETGETKVSEFSDTTEIIGSHGEINYKIFNVSTPSFFLELYELLKNLYEEFVGDSSYYKFDNEVFGNSPFSLNIDKKDDYNNPVTNLTVMRHAISHPNKPHPSEDELNKGITTLLDGIRSLNLN